MVEYTQKGGSALPVAFKRSNPRPIDDDYIQLTAAAAVAYAASSTAYAGQIINIRAAGTVGGTTYRVGLYEIMANGTLRAIATLPEVESLIATRIAEQHIDTIGFQGEFGSAESISNIREDGVRAGSEFVMSHTVAFGDTVLSVGDYIVAIETLTAEQVQAILSEYEDGKDLDKLEEADEMLTSFFSHFVALQQNINDQLVAKQFNEALAANGVLAHTPVGDIALYLNGVLQSPGTDYTVSNNTVTKLAAMGYEAGDEVRVVYTAIDTVS